MNTTIATRLASSLGRRDEAPNIDLAIELAHSGDKDAIDALFNIIDNSTRPLQHDALKVLYETSLRNPGLLLPHLARLTAFLNSRSNRMIWGTLQALDTLTHLAPRHMITNLDKILDAADRSTVVAKDKTMSILSRLNADPRFSTIVSPVLLMRLTHAAPNQFPMYAELAAATIPQIDRSKLARIITHRQKFIASPARQKRLNITLAKLVKPAKNLK